MDYTIVGGGIAAVSAFKAIRALDPHGAITVVSEEEHCFYYRPMTPLVVKGDRERDEILYDHAHLTGISFIHDRAVSLDTAGQEIGLASGKALPYQRLLIATGSAPKVPKIPGIEAAPNVFYLRTLADAQQLNQAAGAARRAVVLGGGLVGIKKACALHHRGLTVTVVEEQPSILIPRLDPEGAAMIAERLAAEGIEIVTSDCVAAILDNGSKVRLASGRELAADMVCVAVGVTPNLAWLAGSGIATDQGILVDKRLATSSGAVYAAGDVVQTRDLITGKPLVSGLWTNAVEMGKVAGTNMAGGKASYEGGLETMNATEIEGLAMISVGDILAEIPGSEVAIRRRDGSYRKLVFDHDRLTGAVFIGEIANAGVYTALIRSGKQLGRLKETAITRPLTYADFCVGR